MMRYLCLILILSSISFNAVAEDLGVLGKTYPIVEPDMLDWIKAKATNLVKSGEWERIRLQTVNTVKNQINNPAPVTGITDATQTKIWYYKPLIQVKQDLTDGRGHLIAKAGTYNALHFKPFNVQLLFINGNNGQQVAWALRKNNESGITSKIILTQGSFMALDKKYKVWFYYDQTGKYTQKLNIKHVPAIVKQVNDELEITELAKSDY